MAEMIFLGIVQITGKGKMDGIRVHDKYGKIIKYIM